MITQLVAAPAASVLTTHNLKEKLLTGRKREKCRMSQITIGLVLPPDWPKKPIFILIGESTHCEHAVT